MALHGVELQVPLEVLGVETRDGQTVAEASLHRDREGIKGLRRLCSLSHRKQQRYNGTNKVFCQVCFVFVGYSFFFEKKMIPGSLNRTESLNKRLNEHLDACGLHRKATRWHMVQLTVSLHLYLFFNVCRSE